MNSGPILIVGGGLGGLTTALALGRRGIKVTVLEASGFGAIGYGIQFGPNIFHVFERLGIASEVLRFADQPPTVMMLDAFTAAEVTRVPTGSSFRKRFRYPYITMHRIDLHNVLMEACRKLKPITLEAGARVVRFECHPNRVSVNTEDGRVFEGEVVIAADGIHSRARAQILSDGDIVPNGYVAHRTIVPMQRVPSDVPNDKVVLWGGPGFHVVHYPLRFGTLLNIVTVYRDPRLSNEDGPTSHRAQLHHTVRNAHPTVGKLVAMVDVSRRFIVGDRDPVRRWHRNRVVLIGDAIHPTLQSLAQGACMAIEDGLCLAQLICASGSDYEQAFTRFAAVRYLRTARVTLESRHLWNFYHADGIEREVLWQAAGERSELDTFQCLAWLYDGFQFPTS